MAWDRLLVRTYIELNQILLNTVATGYRFALSTEGIQSSTRRQVPSLSSWKMHLEGFLHFYGEEGW